MNNREAYNSPAGCSEESYKNFYVTTAEIAAFLCISRVAVFKRIKSGKLKAEKSGGNYIVSLYDLEKHLDNMLSIYDFLDIRDKLYKKP